MIIVILILLFLIFLNAMLTKPIIKQTKAISEINKINSTNFILNKKDSIRKKDSIETKKLKLTKPKIPPKFATKIEWDLLKQSIGYAESRYDSMVIGPGNCWGYLQLTPIYIRQCNIIVGYEKYTLEDRLSKVKSLEMFEIYQSHFNRKKDIYYAIRLHNPGSGPGYRDTILFKFNQLKLKYNIQ